jgi:hypothetical protein
VSARQEANARAAHRALVATFYAGLDEARQADPPGYAEVVDELISGVAEAATPVGTASSYDEAVAVALALRNEHRSVVRFDRWTTAGGVARMQHHGLHPVEVREFGREVGTQLVRWASACVDRTLSLAPSAPLPGATNFPMEGGVRLSMQGQQLIATISIPKPHVETVTTAVAEQKEAACCWTTCLSTTSRSQWRTGGPTSPG